MKRIIIIAAMTLMSMAAFAQETSDTTVAPAPKFACVHFDELLYLMPDMDEVRTILSQNSQTHQEIFMDMYNEYLAKRQQYQQNVANWTQSVREIKEKEIIDIESRLQMTQQSFQEELMQLEEQHKARLTAKVTEVVSALAQELGVTALFDKTDLIYFDETQMIDLTRDARLILGIPDDRTLETLQAELEAQAQAMQASMSGM